MEGEARPRLALLFVALQKRSAAWRQGKWRSSRTWVADRTIGAMSIFRNQALDRLSSPEGLNQAIVAASPGHWIAFLATFLVVGAGVAWGFLGSVPTRVDAEGILLNGGSKVFSASSEGNGELSRILVRLGDAVTAGQPLAELEQNVELRRIERAAAELLDLEQHFEEERRLASDDAAFRRDYAAKRRKSLLAKIENAADRHQNLKSLVADTAELAEKGYILRSKVLSMRNDLYAVREELLDLRNALVKLDEDDRSASTTSRDRVNSLEREIERKKSELDNLRQTYLRIHDIDAPISGIVTEISASVGQVISAGTPIVRIIAEATRLEALLFVSPGQGKLIKIGLPANIEPSTAKKEEFGTIRSEVQSVSQLPLSSAAIRAMLHNDELVERFTTKGAPVSIRTRLFEGEDGGGSLVWSGGGRGPDFKIEQGTLVSATITVREQRPVTLILPFLKSFLGTSAS